MKFLGTQTQIRPCIASIARFPLGLKLAPPIHNSPQRCSFDYWVSVIDTLLHFHPNNMHNRNAAILYFDQI